APLPRRRDVIGRSRRVRLLASARPREGDPRRSFGGRRILNWISPCAGMNGEKLSSERGAADQNLIAVEQHDLDGDVAAFDHALSGAVPSTGHLIAEPDAFGLRQRKDFGRVVGPDDARTKPLGAAGTPR